MPSAAMQCSEKLYQEETSINRVRYQQIPSINSWLENNRKAEERNWKNSENQEGKLMSAGSRRKTSMAERTGLEPATSGVTGRHSNQLNYRSA